MAAAADFDGLLLHRARDQVHDLARLAGRLGLGKHLWMDTGFHSRNSVANGNGNATIKTAWDGGKGGGLVQRKIVIQRIP